MISHGKEVKVFAGNSNLPLANAICQQLSRKLGNCTVSAFADGEVSLSLGEPVRGSDVFIVQPTCKPVNDNLMELLVMIDAMRRASAGRITAVFSLPRRGERCRGYLTYGVETVEEGWLLDSWSNYTHQVKWLNYPAMTAQEYDRSGIWNGFGAFHTAQTAIQFYPASEAEKGSYQTR